MSFQDVYTTSQRRIDVETTSCVYGEDFLHQQKATNGRNIKIMCLDFCFRTYSNFTACKKLKTALVFQTYQDKYIFSDYLNFQFEIVWTSTYWLIRASAIFELSKSVTMTYIFSDLHCYPAFD